VAVDTVVDGIPILEAVKAILADRDTAADIKNSPSMHYRVRQ
jgi:hypothetical protein